MVAMPTVIFQLWFNHQWRLSLPRHKNIGGGKVFCSRYPYGRVHDPDEVRLNILQNLQV